MSALALPNGDDHPEAARRHLADATVLLSTGSPDGAAYLSGYVVECALKSLLTYEMSAASGIPPRSHNLSHLAGELGKFAALAGTRTARYFGAATRGIPTSAISAWTPEMRYRAGVLNHVSATAWHSEANDVYRETVGQMILDGVL